MANFSVQDILGKNFKFEQKVVTEFLRDEVTGTVFGTAGGANWGPINVPTTITGGLRSFRSKFGKVPTATECPDSAGLAMEYHLNISQRSLFTRLADGSQNKSEKEFLIPATSGSLVGDTRVNTAQFVIFNNADGLDKQNNIVKVDVDGSGIQTLTLTNSVSAKASAVSVTLSAAPTAVYNVNDIISFKIDGTTYNYVVQTGDAFNTITIASISAFLTALKSAIDTLILDVSTYPERASIVSVSSPSITFNSLTRGSNSNITINAFPKLWSTLPTPTVGSNTSAFTIVEEINSLLEALSPSAKAYFDIGGKVVITSDLTGALSSIELVTVDGTSTDEVFATGNGTDEITGALDYNGLDHTVATTLKFYDESVFSAISAENIGTGDTVITNITGTLAQGVIKTGSNAVTISWTGGGPETLTLSTAGVLSGGTVVSGTIDPITGAYDIDFTVAPGVGAITIDYNYHTLVTVSGVTFNSSGSMTSVHTALDSAAVEFDTGEITFMFDAAHTPVANSDITLTYNYKSTTSTPYTLLGLDNALNTVYSGTAALAGGKALAKYTGTEGDTIALTFQTTEDGVNCLVQFQGAVVDSFFGISFVKTDSNYFGALINASDLLAEVVEFQEPIGSGPVISDGTYFLTGGASGTASLVDNDYVLALDEYKSVNLYEVDILAIPGNTSVAVADKLQEVCEFRQDCIAIVDPPYGLNTQQVINWHNGALTGVRTTALDSYFVATYWPWVQIKTSSTTSPNQWHGPSVRVVGAIAQSDKSLGLPLGAPAGLRTALSSVEDLEVYLRDDQAERVYADSLGNNINPIVYSIANGYTIEGQKSTQKTQNALNRLNAVRTSVFLKKNIQADIARFFWRPSNAATWAEFADMISGIMRIMVDAQAIEGDFTVKCDATTNTPNVVAANGMVATVDYRVIKTVERIKVISTIIDQQISFTLG